MRIAFVVQRFGDDIIGGAEAHARMVAYHLHQSLGWDITVITTTAKDYTTWRTAYPEGISQDGPLRVIRFCPLIRRSRLIFGIYNRAMAPILRRFRQLPLLARLARPLEVLWYILQGPYCPQIPDYLKAHSTEYAALFFFTYLYYPTAFGISEAKEKAVLIPTAHDEPAFFFQRTAEALSSARYVFANTESERDLITTAYPKSVNKISIVGIGLRKFEREKIALLVKEGLPNFEAETFLLYLGRVSRGKGIDQLCSNFMDYLHQTGDQRLVLVIAGQLADYVIPEHPQIKFVGQVGDQEKYSLIARSLCLVNPSPMESMSLVVLEALSLRRPVLANGRCQIFKYYAKELATVRVYHNQSEFVQLLKLLREQNGCDDDALNYSQDWVEQRFSWDKVLEHYARAGNAIVGNLNLESTSAETC